MAKVTMEELLKAHSVKIHNFKRGDRVKAKLIKKTPTAVYFDIGGKSEGVLTGDFLREAGDLLVSLKKGDEIKAVILEPETTDGFILLSLRQASQKATWTRLIEAKKNDEEVSVIGVSRARSGLLVSVDSLDGFVPMSQFGEKAKKDLDKLIGKSFKVKVLDIDEEKDRAVFSEKAVSESQKIEEQSKALEAAKEKEVYLGKVTEIVDFGAFVEIKVEVKGKKVPLEGLVHISEFSWEKVQKPEDKVKVGDKVEVVVIGKENGKLSLSMKHATRDPWEKVTEKYKVEENIKGKVTKKSDFGVFVELEPGIEGLIHITKIPPSREIKRGDDIECFIEEIDPKEKKISLGLVLTSKPVGYK